MSSIAVHGYSGCPIRVARARDVLPSHSAAAVVDGLVSAVKHTDFVVEKAAASPAYAPRLLQQAAKQQFFHEMLVASRHSDAAGSASTEGPTGPRCPSASPLSVLTSPFPLSEPSHSGCASRDLAGVWASHLSRVSGGGNCGNAAAVHQIDGVTVPPILWIEEHSEPRGERATLPENATADSGSSAAYRVVMPFAHHTDCPRFLAAATMDRINRFEGRVTAVLKMFVSRSPLCDFPAAVAEAKLADVAHAAGRNKILQRTAWEGHSFASETGASVCANEKDLTSIHVLVSARLPERIDVVLDTLGTKRRDGMSLAAATQIVVDFLLQSLRPVRGNATDKTHADCAAAEPALAMAVSSPAVGTPAGVAGGVLLAPPLSHATPQGSPAARLEPTACVPMRIPIGLCHGDLTLSNILVQEHQGDRIVLIDFLDSFVESPLADLAKLRQDLVHGWTLQMLRSRDDFIDGVRLYVLHRRLYERVVLAPFAAEPWFAFGFFFFSVVNQLRVLQYSKDAAIATYLMRTIVRDLTDWRAFLLA